MSFFLAPRFVSGPPDTQKLDRHPQPLETGPPGVLLINLGTPDQSDAKSIRRYLAEFLSDPRVIELPALMWQPILRGIILPLRPRRLQHKYRQIWLEQGSPLLVYSEAQARGIEQALAQLCARRELEFDTTAGTEPGQTAQGQPGATAEAQFGSTADAESAHLEPAQPDVGRQAELDTAMGAKPGQMTQSEPPVELAMRYGNPSIEEALDKLRQRGCERILVVPMYPQYAASTTATAVDAVASIAARLRNQPELRFIKRYHTQPEYIGALARQVRAHWATHGKPQRLLLSFHGLPRTVVEQGDPYHRDCMETANQLAQHLGEDGHLVHVSFQSRFGAQKWLEPYTQPTLEAWAQQGCTHVDVICPGFLADCLETLEEIQIECRDAFLAAGGKQFNFIPCLNDDPHWATGFAQIIHRHLGGWL